MSIEVAEQRKREWTDQYVVVDEQVPELRRFAGLTGTVKTVNMNGQALVQFDGPEDIGWYDIDPGYLTVVEAPVKKKPAAAKPAKAGRSQAKPAAKGPKSGGGKSPLELAREQGAAGAAKPAVDSKPADPKTEGKKLSPLELARQQGAAKQQATAETKSAAKPPAKSSPTQSPGKKLSPLERARQQDGAGTAESTTVREEPTTVEEPAGESTETPSAAASTPAQTTHPDGKPLSIIELARQQGAFKG